MEFAKKYGSRAEVMHGVAEMTTGRIKKSGLMKNKHGDIVSKKLSLRAKKEKRLEKAGYFTVKGKFGAVKMDKKKKSKTKRKRI